MIALALGLALVLRAQDAVPAQPAPVPAARTADAPPTRLAAELRETGALVAVTSTVSASNAGIGTALVRLRIDERLGEGTLRAGDEAVVLAYAGDFRKGGRDLVHLLPIGRRGRWALRQRVDGRDPDFRAKIDVTRRTLALLALEDRARQEAAAWELMLTLLQAADAWSRSYAVGELRWMARHRRLLFTEDRTRRMGLIGATSPHASVRAGVESVAILLTLDDLSLPRSPQSESSSR